MKTLGLIFGTIALFFGTTTAAQFSSEWMTATTARTLGSWGSVADSLIYDDANRAVSGTAADSFCVYGFYPMLTSDATVDSFLVEVDGNASSATAAKRIISVSLTYDSGVTKCGDIVSDTLNQSSDAISTISSGSNTMTNATWNCTATNVQIVGRGFGVIIKKASGSLNADYIDRVRLRIVWSSATAHYMTYGRGANECTDTYLRQNAATTNYSTDTTIALGSTTGPGDARIAVFNFGKPAKDSIAGRTVTRAYAHLHSYGNSIPAKSDSLQCNALRRLTTDVTQATYNRFRCVAVCTVDSAWTTAGAFSTSGDIYSSLSLHDSSWYVGNFRENILNVTELLQSLDESNTDSVFYTIRDLTTSSGGVYVEVSSANASTAAWRPFLRILTGGTWPGTATSSPARRRILIQGMSYKERINAYCITG